MGLQCKSSDAKETPGYKTWKDRLSMLLCGKTAGNVGKYMAYIKFVTICAFRHLLGVLELISRR
jgi:hypothetical protein